MFKNKWVRISLFVFLIPLIVSILFYSQLPEQIPIHFDAAGNVDGYSPKFLGLFGTIGFVFVAHLITMFMILKSPKNENIPNIMIILTSLICPVLCLVVTCVCIYSALGGSSDIILIVINASIAVLMIALGNYLPKTKRNYTVGIRTPWTIDNDENWNRTHRFGGYCMVLGGVLYLILVFMHHAIAGVVVLLVLSFLPCVYSYLISIKK